VVERPFQHEEVVVVVEKKKEGSDESATYFLSRAEGTIYKCDDKITTTYTGLPVGCSCPSYDHCTDRPQVCKHLLLWRKWFSDDGVFLQPESVTHDKAMEAYGIFYLRTNKMCEFVRFHLNDSGQVLQVLVRVKLEDWEGTITIGSVSGVVFRVHGLGVEVGPIM